MAPAATMTRAAIVAVALLLVWRIIQANVVSFDGSGRPRLPGAASSIGASAAEEPSPGHILAESPAQVGALLGLAQELESKGDAVRATKAFAAALDLAPVDRRVLALSSLHFLRRDDARGLSFSRAWPRTTRKRARGHRFTI